jgi:hypothetical protein
LLLAAEGQALVACGVNRISMMRVKAACS